MSRRFPIRVRFLNGLTGIVTAEWKKTDGEVAYFEARIDPLWAGDSVECFAEHKLKNGPDDKATRSAPSSFRVIDSREKPRVMPKAAVVSHVPSVAASPNLE